MATYYEARRGLSLIVAAPLLFGIQPIIRRATASIEGRVTEERSGHPIPGALVLIPSSRFNTRTDSLGHFELTAVPALPAGKPDYADTTIRVVVRKFGYLPEQRELLVRAGERNVIDFRMRPDPRPVR